jgi:hypothetical protein
MSQNNIVYRTLKKIRKGREITINYNGDPESQIEVDFDVDPKTAAERKQDTRTHFSDRPWVNAWCGADPDDGVHIVTSAAEADCPKCLRTMQAIHSMLEERESLKS